MRANDISGWGSYVKPDDPFNQELASEMDEEQLQVRNHRQIKNSGQTNPKSSTANSRFSPTSSRFWVKTPTFLPSNVWCANAQKSEDNFFLLKDNFFIRTCSGGTMYAPPNFGPACCNTNARQICYRPAFSTLSDRLAPTITSPMRWDEQRPHLKSLTYFLNIPIHCAVTLSKGTRIIKASHFMKRYHLGRKISFVCVARGMG